MLLTTIPADYDNPPVTVAQCLPDLAFEDDSQNDRVLQLIWRSIGEIEGMTGRSWAAATYKYTIDGFPLSQYQQYLQFQQNWVNTQWTNNQPWFKPIRQRVYLPRPPLATITSVQYYDVNNTQQTLASNQYYMLTGDFEQGFIEAVDSFPATTYRPDAVQITYTTTDPVRNHVFFDAVKAMVCWKNENRESGDVPKGIDRLIGLLRDGRYC